MTTPARQRRFRTWIVGRDSLGFKLGLLSLVAYLPGFRWALPHATHAATVRGWAIDSVSGISTLAELHNLFVHPAADWYTAYPVFHYLFLATLYAPYLLYLKLTGSFANPSADFPFGFADPEAALRVLGGTGQMVSLLMAAATVWIAYHIAKALGNRTAGVLAALMVMLAGPMVYYSRTGNLDVPVQFWTAAGLLVGVYALQRGLSVRFGALLGLLAALSVATKDQAYGLWIPALLYLVVHHLREAGRDGRTGFARWKPVVALVGSGAAGYALLSGLVFWPNRFVQHLHYIRNFDQTFFNVLNPTGITVLRPPTLSGYLALLGDLVAAVAEAIGPVSLALGIVGLVLLARKSAGGRFLGLALLGYVALTIIPVRHMQYRYTIFPAFALAVFAGTVGANLLTARAASIRVAGAALLALAVGTEGFRAFDLTYQMVRDARYPASAWLQAQARPGDRIGFFGAFHQLPALPPGLEPVQLRGDSGLRMLGEGKLRYVYVAPDYFSDSLHQRSTFLPEEIYARLQNGTLGFRLAERFETGPLRASWLRHFPYVNPPVQVFEAVPGAPAP
jgi:hypothetical protein